MRRHLARVVVACLVLAPVSVRAQERGFWAEARVLRPVLVRLPGPRAGADPPLVVGLHGRGGTAATFVRLWDELEDPGFVLAVPEAPNAMAFVDTSTPLGWSWFLPTEDRSLWERADPLAAEYVLGVIRELRRDRPPGGVYLLGFSQGVSCAYLTAARAPEQIDGVIAFAGVLPKDTPTDETLRAAAARVAVFIAHGSRDRAVAIDRSREAKARLEGLGFAVTFREFKGDHELPRAALRDAAAWVEARERARRPTAGPTPRAAP